MPTRARHAWLGICDDVLPLSPRDAGADDLRHPDGRAPNREVDGHVAEQPTAPGGHARKKEDDRGGNGVCRAGARRGHPRDGGRRPSRPGRLPHVAALDADARPAWRDGDAPADGRRPARQRLRVRGDPRRHLVLPRHRGVVDVYVNHETSKVPFPYVTAAPTAANGENDFDNAQLSHLVLTRSGAATLSGELVIDSSEGYQRFCSNYLATRREGFHRPTLFTNEETPDYVYRREASWPPVPGSPDEREGGVVVAMDVKKGSARADLRHGPSQPRELRPRSGVRQAGRALGRRHVHQRAAHRARPVRVRCRRSRRSTPTSPRTRSP